MYIVGWEHARDVRQISYIGLSAWPPHLTTEMKDQSWQLRVARCEENMNTRTAKNTCVGWEHARRAYSYPMHGFLVVLMYWSRSRRATRGCHEIDLLSQFWYGMVTQKACTRYEIYLTSLGFSKEASVCHLGRFGICFMPRALWSGQPTAAVGR